MSRVSTQTPAETLTAKEWTPLLELLEDMSGFGFSVLDPTGAKLAETDIFPPVCKLMHSSETGSEMCKNCWASIITGAHAGVASVSYCHAQMANVVAPIRVGSQLLGYLVGGEARVDDPATQDEAEEVLAELAADVDIPAEELIEAYRQSPGISPADLKKREGRFERLVRGLSGLVSQAWLAHVTHWVQSCVKRDSLQEFWPAVGEGAALLVPASSVQVIAVAPGETAFAQMWPQRDESPELLTHEQLECAAKYGFASGGSEDLLVLGRSQEVTLFVLRLRPPEGAEYTDVDTDQLVKFAEAAAGALELLRAKATKGATAALEQRLSQTKGHGRRLETVLNQAVEMLGCDVSYIALVDSKSRKWLRVVARHGAKSERIPYFVPADIGITGRVLRDQQTAVVPRTVDDPDFLDALSARGRLSERYSEERWQQYRDFLGEIRACVKVPLVAGSDVVGVMCLHRSREGMFDVDAFQVLDAFAKRAVLEAARFLAAQRSPSERSLPKEVYRTSEDIASRFASLDLADARHELAQELAELALQMSGAYRTAVQFISPDRETLGCISKASSEEGAWPKEFDLPFPVKEDCAATHAFKNGRTYTIEDTGQRGIHYKPFQPEAKSHASLLLRSGRQQIGILSVDWKRTGAFTPVTIRELQGLADSYASALRMFGVDESFRRFEKNLEECKTTNREIDYQTLLQSVAEMVSVREGAIFLRRPDTGRFHLAAHLRHPEWSSDDHWYEPGQGVTGWIARHNRSLNLKDLSDNAELRAIAEDLMWEDNVYDGEIRGARKNFSYLGVPIAAGSEIFGVLRLADVLKGAFSPYDLQIVLAAASRLAGLLVERSESQRLSTLMKLSAEVALAESQKEVAHKIFDALNEGIGECACHIRVLDKRQDTSGQVEEVLSRLAVSHADWESTPYYRARGTGIAGRVWETERSYVYQTLQEEDWIKRAMQEDLNAKNLLEKVGSGACVPIIAKGVLVGTLHVHKRCPQALSAREIEFLREVAQFAARALQRARETEEGRLEIKLAEAVHEFLTGLLGGAPTAEQERQLLEVALEALQDSFQSPWAWVRIPDSTKTVFRVALARGIEPKNLPELAARDMMAQLREGGFIIIENAMEFGAKHGKEYRDVLEKANGCAIAMAAKAEPLALFSVLVSPSDHISYHRAAEATKMLQRLGELILLGRAFEQQKRDAEVSRPLTLVGSLISGYEHQLFGPLSRLKLDLEFMSAKPRSPEMTARKLAEMAEDRFVLESCLSHLRGAVGQWEHRFTPMPLVEVLESAIQDAGANRAAASVIRDFPEDVIEVMGNPEYLRTAFQLLTRNAFQAVQCKGTDGMVVVGLNVGAERCTATISDNGPGMSETVRKRAFEPFFTTKTKGMGMGLPAAYCIIRCHDGSIEIESDVDRGTYIIVTLPLHKGT